MAEPSTAKPTLVSRALRVFSIIAGVGIFAMMLHVLANVFMRYFFNSPIPNTLEVVSYWYMPIVAYLGFVLAKAAKEFIDAPLIFDSLTWGNRRILVIVFSIIGIGGCLLFAYFTFVDEALHGLATQATGGVSNLPIWPVFFLPPAIFVILAVMYGWDLVKAARGEIDEPESAEDALGDIADELEAELQQQEAKSEK